MQTNYRWSFRGSRFVTPTLFAALLIAGNAFAVTGDNFSYNGYMRAGSGSNTNGASQACYHQSGVPGNEFRLGNECGIYGEAMFTAYTEKPKNPGDEFFRANFGISYNPSGNTVTQAPNLYVFGTYVEAGRVGGAPETYWVGRRYYRDADVHIDDFYYFADTSGSGAGVQDIPIGGAKGHVAIMMQDTDQKNSVTVNGQTQVLPEQTENGRPRTMLLDLRLFDVRLNERDQLNFWGGWAMVNGGGRDVNTGQTFPNARGGVIGVKYHLQESTGYNNFAFIYGRGLMQGMNLGGYFGADPAQLLNGQAYHDSAARLRFVEEFVVQPSPRFATAFAAIYERWNLGESAKWGHWASVGARPVYFFDDHYSLAFEAGFSSVRQSAETRVGSTPMARITIAPQLSPKSEFFSRPVLRLFLTDTVTTDHGMSYGFQGECWF